MDTRNTSVGQTAYVDILLRGLPGDVQGGEAGCGLPYQATGVVLNLIAVAPQSTGHAILWPYGGAFPNTSTINFQGAQTSNDGLMVKLAPSGLGYELSLASSSPAYWVIDLVAYTEPSTASLVGQAESFTGGTLKIRTFSGAGVSVTAPLSAAFFNSWASVISSAVGKCVAVNGFWTGLTTFEARSLPFTATGNCGPG